MEYILRTQGLTKCFKDNEVVSNVNLNIKKGEIYGFLGANGAGKSTIMKMIMNLLQPTSGTIELFGKVMNDEMGETLKRIGAIIENPIFYEKLTARENLELHCEYMGIYNKSDVDEVLNLVHLHGTGKKAVGHFSLGMKQRLALARAIITKPELLILDEPINGLDPEGIVQIRNLLKLLCKEYGMTILISSHILSEIEQLADTIGIIDHGRLLKEVDMNTVHSTNEEYIELVCKDAKTALCILEMKLGIKNMKLMEDDTIRIYDNGSTIGQISKELGMNNIELESISQKKTSLEEYFFKLTKGGEIHV